MKFYIEIKIIAGTHEDLLKLCEPFIKDGYKNPTNSVNDFGDQFSCYLIKSKGAALEAQMKGMSI